MVDIQSATDEIRQGKKERKKEEKETTGQKYNHLTYSIGMVDIQSATTEIRQGKKRKKERKKERKKKETTGQKYSPRVAMEWFRLLPAFCSVRRMPYKALSMGISLQFSVFFVAGDLDL